MFFLKRPNENRIRDIMQGYRHSRLTYPEVGRTRNSPPAGYKIDHHRVQLGTGEELFRKARQAVDDWEMFHINWLEPCPLHQTIEEGLLVGTLARVCGLWSFNMTRTVYVIEQTGDVEKYGFAYGTLPGHVECGEERFSVEWNRADDIVCYDILAFSKPGLLLTRMTYPVVRRLQKRFARDSIRSMHSVVSR